ncbi:hypothetical protein [Streptomyces sp. NPDC003710]
MLWLAEQRTAPFGRKQALTMFTANAAGAQISQAIGLMREVLTPPKSSKSTPDRRYLIITPAGSATAAAVQDEHQAIEADGGRGVGAEDADALPCDPASRSVVPPR